MNIIKDLTARIQERLAETKTPCKSYATEQAADEAGAQIATLAALHFAKDRFATAETVKPARYVVFRVPGWERWVACIDLTELIQRSSSTGGYLGFCKGFYTF